ncbi:hypothetical protein BX661DRAFT_174464 [Kickxella alabastrina]|uniref:uncharacterized protein n=1 Tax=Kickxella alabastrina TaxID=61397 RepID=UPI00221FD2A9|nr:uncharacterized protein BX661DRAFT_174464 [Kickxella alabastrina]KAI7818489.1 hypothetical protein BX661DRAFT_174464 [Kickxella alabastrina]
MDKTHVFSILTTLLIQLTLATLDQIPTTTTTERYSSNAYPYGGAYNPYNSYGGAGNYGGVDSYGSYISGFPISLSTANKLDSDSFAAKYKEHTVYANNKDASVSKDQINKFDSVNVIA